jgi:hypothetical protein
MYILFTVAILAQAFTNAMCNDCGFTDDPEDDVPYYERHGTSHCSRCGHLRRDGKNPEGCHRCDGCLGDYHFEFRESSDDSSSDDSSSDDESSDNE